MAKGTEVKTKKAVAMKAKVAVPVKLRTGMTVDVQHHNASRIQSGKITEIDETGVKGAWYVVNLGDKRNPIERRYRASQLSKA